MGRRSAVAIAFICTFAAIAGCAAPARRLPATQPTVQTRTPDYWIDQPALYAVEAGDFERLWSAAEAAAQHYGFALDRLDRRGGVITTVPLTSKQWFEFWRNDVATLDGLAKSSLATYRRTLRFDVERLADGRFRAEPRVVIERFVRAEQPIRSSVFLRHAFRADRRRREPVGTRESDRGIFLPRQYWYATGRDTALELNVARTLQNRLART